MHKDYMIHEAARMLQEKGFSINASAAICMWADAKCGFEKPFFFTKEHEEHEFLGSYVNDFVESFEDNWDYTGCKEHDDYHGTLDLDDNFYARRFKEGFIDVLSLLYVFNKCYKG